MRCSRGFCRATRDTRVTVIGHCAFGYRRYNRPGDFRASGSGRLTVTA